MANPYNFILRATKGSALTHQELDDTFRYLNYAIQNVSGGTGSTTTIISGGTDVYVTGGTYSNGTLLFVNNTGGTFTITGITSTSVTGGTNEVLYIKPSGTLSSDSLFTRNRTTGEFSVAGALLASPFDISSINIGTYNIGTSIEGPHLLHELNGGAGGYGLIFMGDATAAGSPILGIIKSNNTQYSSQIAVIPQSITLDSSDGTNDSAVMQSPIQYVIDATYNSIPASSLFYIDLTGATISLGDLTASLNGTKLTIRDDLQQLKFFTASGNTFELDSNGNIRTFFLHDNPTTQGDSSQQDIRSGTYTPTLSGVTNVTGSTASKAQWLRVGNVVTVSGYLTLGCASSADASSVLAISLPVDSNLGSVTDLAGVASNVTNVSGGIFADTTNNRALLQFTASLSGAFGFSWNSQPFLYHFTYEVI